MKQFVLFIIAIFFSTTAAYSQKAAIKVEAINNGDLSRVSILLLGINNGIELPKEFALKQNYPNPFNPTTTIYFDVPKNGTIKIDVFNVFGQCVKTLVNKEYSLGKYSINWNGDDDNYQSVSSGVYFCRMQTEGFVTTRKLVLMK